MEKEIIMFKDNSRLKFFRLFTNLLATTAVHQCDPTIRLINTPLRMCRGIRMYAYKSVTSFSLVIMT